MSAASHPFPAVRVRSRRGLGRILLALFFASPVHANALQDRQFALLETAIEHVLAVSPDVAPHVRVLHGEATPSLLQIRYQRVEETNFPVCTLQIYAPDDEPMWFRYLPAAPDAADRGPLLEALVAHELTHCREYLAAYADLEHSDFVVPALRGTVKGFEDLGAVLGRRDQSLWSETMADIGAFLYLQDRYPERFRALHQSWIEYRRRNRADPGHDTSELLAAVRIEAEPQEAVLSTAHRLRQVAYHLR